MVCQPRRRRLEESIIKPANFGGFPELYACVYTVGSFGFLHPGAMPGGKGGGVTEQPLLALIGRAPEAPHPASGVIITLSFAGTGGK